MSKLSTAEGRCSDRDGEGEGKETATLPEKKTMLLSDCAACFADCAREIESVRTSIIEICRA